MLKMDMRTPFMRTPFMWNEEEKEKGEGERISGSQSGSLGGRKCKVEGKSR